MSEPIFYDWENQLVAYRTKTPGDDQHTVWRKMSPPERQPTIIDANSGKELSHVATYSPVDKTILRYTLDDSGNPTANKSLEKRDVTISWQEQ